jgi:hypothetical protein
MRISIEGQEVDLQTLPGLDLFFPPLGGTIPLGDRPVLREDYDMFTGSKCIYSAKAGLYILGGVYEGGIYGRYLLVHQCTRMGHHDKALWNTSGTRRNESTTYSLKSTSF